MTRKWWDAEALVALVLGTEASLAEHEVVDVPGLLTTQTLPDIDDLERRLQVWDTLAGQISTVPLVELLTEEARSLVVELRLTARYAGESAGALRVRTQRVVPGINGLLTVAQMLGHRVAHLELKGVVAGRCPISRMVPVPCGWVWRERGVSVGHGDRCRLFLWAGASRRFVAVMSRTVVDSGVFGRSAGPLGVFFGVG